MQRKLQHLIVIVAICTMWLMASAHPQSVPVSPFMPGDVNEDRIIDITDVSGIINFMIGGKDLSETQARNADFNHDGKIDIADINGVITLMLGNGYAHVQPMSLVVETRNGSRDVFPLADNPQLSFVGQEMLVKSSGATSYYNRNQLHQMYYMPYTQSQRIARAPRAPMTDNPNQYAIYIYRNDNEFNAHLNIDVESIRFSAVGTDSIWYDNALVQEVWTSDTVFRTPIAAIDSITFQAPNPVLFTVNGVSFTMVAVEGGTFTMGATAEQGDDGDGDEEPAHRVTLSSYHIGQTEVTQALWRAVMGDNPSYFKGDSLPVEKVSWHDCQTFISKLNEMTGKNFRLPTEAEWEYAARGGNRSRGYKYAGGNNIGDVAWYYSNSGEKTHPVGTKAPNELGLYDMSGNVLEWCQDWFGSYNSGAQTNPTGPVSGSFRVRRGGCCSGNAWYCRVSNRKGYSPTFTSLVLGLRLAL